MKEFKTLREATMGPDKLEMLRKAYGSVNKIDPSSPTYKKMEKMIDGMSQDHLKGLAFAKIKFLSMLAATKLRYKHNVKLDFGDYWAESVDHDLEQIEELVSVKSTSWRKSDMSYAVAIKKYNPKQVRKGKDGKAELLGVVESVDESLEEAVQDWTVTVAKPVNKLKKGASQSVKARSAFEAINKAVKLWGDPALKSAPIASFKITKESVEVQLEEGKMKDFHDMVKKGMTAKQIAKKIGFPEKDVAEFMKGMKESVSVAESNTFSVFRKSLSERKDSAADLYFDTYSAAVQHAKAQAEKKGFEVVEDDWFTQVTTGKGKPGRGKTTRHTLKLLKNDKPVRQSLAIQVYNRDTNKNTFELNMYIS